MKRRRKPPPESIDVAFAALGRVIRGIKAGDVAAVHRAALELVALCERLDRRLRPAPPPPPRPAPPPREPREGWWW